MRIMLTQDHLKKIHCKSRLNGLCARSTQHNIYMYMWRKATHSLVDSHIALTVVVATTVTSPSGVSDGHSMPHWDGWSDRGPLTFRVFSNCSTKSTRQLLTTSSTLGAATQSRTLSISSKVRDNTEQTVASLLSSTRTMWKKGRYLTGDLGEMPKCRDERLAVQQLRYSGSLHTETLNCPVSLQPSTQHLHKHDARLSNGFSTTTTTSV